MANFFLNEFLTSSGWQQMQNLLNEVLKTSIIWVADNSGEVLQSLDHKYPRFCRLIRSNPEGLKHCENSHFARIQEAKNNKCSIVSACYCGLEGFALPLVLDDEIVGVAGGCYPTFERQITPDKLTQISSISGIKQEELTAHIRRVSTMSRAEEKRLLSILSMFTGMASLLMKWMNRLFVSLEWEQQYAAKIMALSEIGMIAGSELNWEEMLATIASRTKQLLGVDACSIYVIDRNNRELTLGASDGLTDEYIGRRIKIGDGITGRVAKTRLAMAVDDAESDSRSLTNDNIDYSLIYRGILSMPLVAQDRLIGVIDAYTLDPKKWDQTDISFLSIIAIQVAGTIEKSKFRMELNKELEIAGYIQMRLIPDLPPEVAGYDIAALTVPNSEVSGDYYDFISIDEDHLGIGIADVSGKGIGASILMANTHGLLHAYALTETEAMNVISRANNALYGYTEADKFVTMFYGVLDRKTGTLTYTNAGHNPPFVYRHDDTEPEALEAGGIVLGIIKNASYSEGKTQLAKGDVIVFYSDGVTEAQDAKGEMFGEQRLHDTVQKYIRENANSINAQFLLNWIYDVVQKFTSDVPLADDLTIVVLISTEEVEENGSTRINQGKEEANKIKAT
jgi:sigma-B regulation protein RsbU (phosphoserine phosphatase)